MIEHWSELLKQFPPESSIPDVDSTNCYFSPLDSDILEVTGPDSRKFLQGQTTCNMDDLGADHWMPGAICDPKGRMITSFSLYAKTPDQLLLEMNNGLAALTREAIQKYSAFFKTELIDNSSAWHVTGVSGVNAVDIISRATGLSFSQEATLQRSEDLLLIKVSDARYKLLSETEKTQQIWTKLAALAKPVTQQYWQLLDIVDGIGNVYLETSGEFIPQMLNLQARGGISFRKGCYTGQEIVARMKYLGKLKRHMYHLHLETDRAPAPGTPCFMEPEKGQQGHVVNSINLPNNTLELLAVLSDDLANAGKLFFPDSDALAFAITPLPYSLDA